MLADQAGNMNALAGPAVVERFAYGSPNGASITAEVAREPSVTHHVAPLSTTSP